MRKIKTFAWLIIMAGAVVGGIYNIYLYVSGSSEEDNAVKIETAQKLVDNGVKTMAVLDSVYTERKIKGVTVGKEIKYSFDVNDQKYFGEFTFEDEPSSPIIEITYLKEDPTVNTINPEKRLESVEEKKGSKEPLYFGLGALLIGLIGVFINFNKLKSN